MAILDKKKLACYIISKYQKEHDKEISPIKLQKSLYFLYAMWGGKIADAKMCTDSNTEDDHKYETYDINLFDACFEAWKYGPVDSEVYEWFKNGILCYSDFADALFLESKITYINEAKDYIDELLEKIFRTSDFGLVDMSHTDKCWQEAINSNNKHISNEAIIKDYQA